MGKLIDEHPLVVMKLLNAAKSQDITSDQLLDLFVPLYSDRGSNNRPREESLMHNFCTMLQKCEDGKLLFSCSDVLVFITGASQIPPLGLSPMPSIDFISDDGLPTASTCSNILRIPYTLTEYARFEEVFDLAIRGCQGFGNV